MTKQQEIEILNAAIASLGCDSYLGPWLTQIRAGVADLVKLDIFPDITLADAIRSADCIKQSAHADAADIIAAAKLRADHLEKSADKHKNNVASAMRDSLHVLERF